MDNDGLIDIRNLDQLNAIRYDLDGDGLLITNIEAYNAAFPRPSSGSMGCPNDACSGYELAASLSFDTNGNGQIDQGDQYWERRTRLGTHRCTQRTLQRHLFDGGGFTISDLFIHRPSSSHNGLFGAADAGSNIRQVRLASVNVTGRYQVGGLVGYNRNGAEVVSSYSTGTVQGEDDVGGLVGRNQGNGSITASYSNGSVAASDESAGGLVGLNSDATITASYATGSVNGRVDVGGLVGTNHGDATVTASYATGDVNGSANVGGLVGENNRQHRRRHLCHWSSIHHLRRPPAVWLGTTMGAPSPPAMPLAASTAPETRSADWSG